MAEKKSLTEKAVVSPNNQMQRAVGRAIWRTEIGPKPTVEERASTWSAGRRSYMTYAARLIRNLEKDGFTVTPKATD